MDALISVIVPVYNLENEIEDTLSGIFQQTWRNIEVVAIDDGSTDHSLYIMLEMASSEPRLKVIHQENGGVTSARLAGVREARGEWIGFVDGGDAIEPEMYERLLMNAEKYQTDISHCGYQMIFSNRKDLYYGTGRTVIQDNLTGQKDLLEGRFVEPGLWNKLYKRELFQPILSENLMDLSIRNLEDLLMNYYLFRGAMKSVYEDFCPYHYIVRGGSAATGSLNEHRLKDPLKVLNKIHEECKNQTILEETIRQRILYALVNASTMDDRGRPDLVIPWRNQARSELRRNLAVTLKGNNVKRLKCMAVTAAYAPGLYKLAHGIISRAKGTDRKYATD